MNRLTQTELNEIRQRAEKAAAGADAEFIAHAREDIPRLVAEIERLREGLSAIAEDYNAYDSPDQLAEVAEYYLNGGDNE